MRTKLATIHWPHAGLHRGLAAQTQAPYTTPDCLNVRSVDPMTGRRRGGSRPGLMRSHGPQLGGGNPIRLLASVNHVQTDQFQYWTDGFDWGDISSVWDNSAAPFGGRTWTQASGLAYTTSSSLVGAIRSDISTINTASGKSHQVEIWITPHQGSWAGVTFDLYACCAGAVPPVDDAHDGVHARLSFTSASGAYSAQLTKVESGTPTEGPIVTGNIGLRSGWLSLRMEKTSGTLATATLYFNGESIGSYSGIEVFGNRRFGFGMYTSGQRAQVEAFRVQYTDTGAQQLLRPRLVASSNGVFYRETFFGHMESVPLTPPATLSTDRRMYAADRGQKLYIADGKLIAKHENVASTGMVTTVGITADVGDVLYLAPASDGTSMADTVPGSYRVTASGSTSTVEPAHTPVTGTMAAKYNIYRFLPNKVYDPEANTVKVWGEAGSNVIPAGCRLICRYRDRIVLAGDIVNPHVWYMSRQGDPNDWDFGETDVGRAVSGSGENAAGRVGDPITAIVPYFDDFLIFGCKDSLHILRGDPAYGGQIDVVSNEIGIVDAGAFCFGPAGEIIFLTRQGIYMATADCSECLPISSSIERIPRDLIDVDSNLYDVCMAWDQRDGGIHVWLNPRTGTIGGLTCWWIDWETKSYWPVRPSSTSFYASTIWQHKAADPVDSAVIFGGRDGRIRRHYDWAVNDDGVDFSSHITLGPFRPGGSDWHDGILAEIVGTAASGGGSLAWSVMRAATAESVLDSSTALFSGTWPAGRSYTSHPRARGGAFKVKLSGLGHPWGFEQATMLFRSAGKQRIR